MQGNFSSGIKLYNINLISIGDYVYIIRKNLAYQEKEEYIEIKDRKSLRNIRDADSTWLIVGKGVEKGQAVFLPFPLLLAPLWTPENIFYVPSFRILLTQRLRPAILWPLILYKLASTYLGYIHMVSHQRPKLCTYCLPPGNVSDVTVWEPVP